MGVMSGTLDLIQRAYTGQPRSATASCTSRRRSPSGSTGLSFPMQFRGTPIRVTARRRRADRRSHHRGLQPADQGRRRRRRARARRRASAARSRSSRARRPLVTSERHREDDVAEGFRGAIFDVDGVLVDSPHEAAWRDALRGAHGGRVGRHPRPDARWSPEAFTPQVYQQVHVGQAAHGGRAARRSSTSGCPTPRRASRPTPSASRTMVIELIEAGKFYGLPRRAALRARRQGRGDPGRRGVVVEERRALPAPDPARHVRRARRASTTTSSTPGLTPARLLRRRHLGPRLRAGQAASRDLPHRGRGARRRRPTAAFVDRGRRVRHPGGEGGRHGGARARRAPTTRRRCAGADADIVVTSLDDVDLEQLARGRLVKKGG